MPIQENDIKIKRSGDECLGGAISDLDVRETMCDLFDVVTGQESLNGNIEYRCIYIKNEHPELVLYNAVAFIEFNTPCVGTHIEIGVGIAAKNLSEDAILNEDIAPLGVFFASPETASQGLYLGDLAPNEYRALWLKRIVSAGTAAYNTDGVHLGIFGDSAA